MEVRTVLVILLSRFHFELDQEVGGAEEVSYGQRMRSEKMQDPRV